MKKYVMLGLAAMLSAALMAGIVIAAMGPGGAGKGPGGMRGGPPGAMQPGGGPGQPGGGQGGPGEMRPQTPPGPGPLIKRLEGELGTPLTEDQKGQIADAAKAHFEAVMAAHKAFAQKLAKVTGIPEEKLRDILPPGPPPMAPGGPRMQHPPQGGQQGPPPPPPAGGQN